MITTALTTHITNAVDSASHTVLTASGTSTVAADDITGTLNKLVGDLQVTATAAAGLMAVVFILYKAFKTGFSTAGIVSAILLAGLMCWGVWNVTDVQESVDNQLNGAGTTYLDGPVTQPSEHPTPQVL